MSVGTKVEDRKMKEEDPFKNGRYVLGELVYKQIKENLIEITVAAKDRNPDSIGTDEFELFQDIAEKIIKLSKTLPQPKK